MFPQPQPGASLLLAFNPAYPAPPSTSTATATAIPSRKTFFVIGQHRLTAVRVFAALEAGLRVVLARDSQAPLDPEVQHRINSGEIEVVLDLPSWSTSTTGATASDWRTWLQDGKCVPEDILDDIALVCITDTIRLASSSLNPRSPSSALAIRQACYSLRIPVNVADHPELSDYSFPATHRFPLLLPEQATATHENGLPSRRSTTASPLQIAITTNAKSCRFSSRIRREIVSKLPKGIGSAVEKIGKLREEVKKLDEEAAAAAGATVVDGLEQGEKEEGFSSSLLNKPVPQIFMNDHASSTRLSKCTSPNRQMKSLPPSFASQHPSILPLTPPPTPPATSFVVNRMEEILSGQDVTSTDSKSEVVSSLTRMRFISQISEYWPIERLASMTDEEAARVISLYSKNMSTSSTSTSSNAVTDSQTQNRSGTAPQNSGSAGGLTDGAAASISNDTDLVTPRHGLALDQSLVPAPPSKKGKIFLLGSGPGSPALLTMAAHSLLTKEATLILSDKLVPHEVLALIPKSIPLIIAKKFPGNAEGAQNELMDLALEGARKGETVVRLKQGDPYVYGRGGEEVLFFRKRGFESVVIPGISSTFSAPLMFNVPVTQRGVSESVLISTGVGRKGRGVKLPGYERSRTLVVLMGVARLPSVVSTLISDEGTEGPNSGREGGGRDADGKKFPPYCPIAIIERGSSPDQRMVASTLENIVEALDREGEQRPPGMMVIGWSVLALENEGNINILDGIEGLSEEELEKADKDRVKEWLGPKGYICREGLDPNFAELCREDSEAVRVIEEL